MIESIHTSETSVYFNEATRRYIPEGFVLVLCLYCVCFAYYHYYLIAFSWFFLYFIFITIPVEIFYSCAMISHKGIGVQCNFNIQEYGLKIT
jgi:hypothetical protein